MHRAAFLRSNPPYAPAVFLSHFLNLVRSRRIESVVPASERKPGSDSQWHRQAQPQIEFLMFFLLRGNRLQKARESRTDLKQLSEVIAVAGKLRQFPFAGMRKRERSSGMD